MLGKEIIAMTIVLAFIGTLATIYVKNNTIHKLEMELHSLTLANTKAKEEHKADLVEFAKEAEVIYTTTKAELKYIETYKGDSNDNCKNANNLLSNTKY